MTTTDTTDTTAQAAEPVCGAGVWLLATTGPGQLEEHRAYRTHCQAAPDHPGDHTVRVAGEPDDTTSPAQPVTLTWPNVPVADCRCGHVVGLHDELGCMGLAFGSAGYPGGEGCDCPRYTPPAEAAESGDGIGRNPEPTW